MPRRTILSKDDEALIAMAADRLEEMVQERSPVYEHQQRVDDVYDMGTWNIIRDLRLLVGP